MAIYTKEHPLRNGILLFLVMFGVALNIAGAFLAQSLKLPLYLDSFMSFVIVAVGGLVPGLLTAVLTNGFLGTWGPVGMPFMVCHIFTVIGAWLIFERLPTSFYSFLWAGLLSALTNGLVGSLISMVVYQGVTSIPQIDNLVLGVVTALQDKWVAVFWGGIQSNLIDKLVSTFIAFGLWTALSALLRRRAQLGEQNE